MAKDSVLEDAKVEGVVEQTKLALSAEIEGVTGCGITTTEATETEKTLCRNLGESLPTRSHSDTGQTQLEISELYRDFSNACPAFAYLVPQ